MQKHLFRFPCPCCGKQIEVDTRTEKAHAVVPAEGKQGDLDQLLSKQQRERERLGDAFDTAKKRQQNLGKHLDDLLDQAKKDARENPDEKLRRPWDLE